MSAKMENGCLVVASKTACGAAELEGRMRAIVNLVAHADHNNLNGDSICYLMKILSDMLPNEQQISCYLLREK
jgi:hypothetical protein